MGDLNQEANSAVQAHNRKDSSSTAQGTVDFIGVSGLTYVADFVRWWVAQQQATHPSTKAFLEA